MKSEVDVAALLQREVAQYRACREAIQVIIVSIRELGVAEYTRQIEYQRGQKESAFQRALAYSIVLGVSVADFTDMLHREPQSVDPQPMAWGEMSDEERRSASYEQGDDVEEFGREDISYEPGMAGDDDDDDDDAVVCDNCGHVNAASALPSLCELCSVVV